MNDHNLDDLIIDNIEPKNSKAKSMLTIVALLIVVLIVAIILTSVILEDPKPDQDLSQNNETEMVSPELTLENVGKVKEPEDEPKLNEIIEEELNKPTVEKQEEIIPKAEAIQEEVAKVVEPKVTETIQNIPEVKSVKITDEFKQTPEVTQPKAVEKPKVTTPPAHKEVKKIVPAPTTTAVSYYIQVGSFSQTPSKRFLSVITNSGFQYKITTPTANGTKKLLIGPYSDRKSVDNALVRVRDRINKSAFVVKK